MTEMQSAIGRIALKKVPGWVVTRRRHASALNTGLADVRGLRIPLPADNVYHAYYKYYAFVQPEMLKPGWNRDAIMQAILAEGVACFVGSCSEIYLEGAFDGIRPAARFPVAQELGETSLMFMVHPTLSDEHMALTCRAIKKVMQQAAKSTVYPVAMAKAAASHS
jgi:dTDP-4-amino-4,6-dideoxygalactose transaminase